jgi:outer membrane protein OmpA-like peptidoglycan-associated protein
MYIYKHIRQSIALILGLTFLAQIGYSQESSNSDSIYVIVGSFKNQYNAIYLGRDLRKKGFKNAISLNRKNGFYRVSIERFSEIGKAKKFVEENRLKMSEFWYQYSDGQIIDNYDEKPTNNISTEIGSKLSEKSNKEVKVTEPSKELLKTNLKENKQKSKINIIDTAKFEPQLNIKDDLKSKFIINEKPNPSNLIVNQNPDFNLENNVYNSFSYNNQNGKFQPHQNFETDSLSRLYDPKSRRQRQNIFTARSNFESYEYSPAIEKYLKIVRSGRASKEAYQFLALSFFNNSQYDLATVWFNKLISTYPKGLDPEIYFKAAISFKSIEAYEVADQLTEKYLKLTNNPISQNNYTSSKNYLDDIFESEFIYQLFETKINSGKSDFGPNFYSNNEIIFSSSEDATGSKNYDWSNEPFLDLFVAEIDSLGELVDKERLGGEVNTKFHESSATVSKDGKTMYFTRNNYFNGKLRKSRDNEVKLKVYKATKNKDNSWGSIKELPFNGNDFSVAHPALSPDGKKLYFSSDMPGTFGKSDIWFVYIYDNDEYSQPINLGPNVNTEFRESFPFVDDSLNLFYSSDGKMGLGGFDVFSSTLNSRGFPSKTENLGIPLNSPFDDFGFVFKNRLGFGYFSSNRSGPNGSSSDQVYRITRTLRPKKQVTVYRNEVIQNQVDYKRPQECSPSISGSVYDIYTRELLVGSLVELLNQNDNPIDETIADEKGQFYFPKRDYYCENRYKLRVSNGLGYNSRIVDLIFDDSPNIIENVGLKWNKECLPYDLICLLNIEPIYFDLDKYTLRPSSIISLNEVFKTLIKYPNMVLEVNSYADSRASIPYNRVLSLRRAQVTKSWLVKKGIDSNRLLIKAYGEENIDNLCGENVDCSEREYQLNRKSSFKILKF